MNWNYLFMIALFLLQISLVGIGYLAHDDIKSFIINIRSEEAKVPGDCINLSMDETAHCLNRYVREIYNYTITEDSETLSLEELIEKGGDCLNWAELYVGYINELGFESEMPMIDTQNNTMHTFAIISDSTGYCILDQTNINCYKLGTLVTQE